MKLSLKWRGGLLRPPTGPRQVLGPYGRAYEPTGHLRDFAGYGPGREREGVLEVLSDDLVQLHNVQQHLTREPGFGFRVSSFEKRKMKGRFLKNAETRDVSGP